MYNFGCLPLQLGQSGRSVQMAPTLDHQAHAMVSLLDRYNWTSFSIVTSQVTGASEFVASLEALEARSKDIKLNMEGQSRKKSLEILSVVHISDLNNVREDLEELRGTDTRIFLLHCSSKDAYNIMEVATEVGLTGKEYQWILTQSSIPMGKFARKSFPVGMLGINFDYGEETMKAFVRHGMTIWLSTLNDLAKQPKLFANKTIPPNFTCDSDQNHYWQDGEVIHKQMLDVVIPDEPGIRFNQNGTLQRTELNIINLQWNDEKKFRIRWREVGQWKLQGLTMQDITWPGGSSVPPIGRPKRGFLRVATLNELPYVIYRPLEADGTCGEKTLPCWIYPRHKDSKKPISNVTQPRCCVGLSMDLLKIFSEELNFDFHIKEVEDGKWGGKDGQRWNGLVQILLSGEADIVMTSFKINPERAGAIRFSVPYLETGIKIIVALRDGAISPTAFL
ncbi:ionotropic glutamate receptor nmda 2b, partial [Plakobranchus ocellatus]